MSDETEAFSRLFKNKLYILITSGGKIELFSFLSIVNITKYLWRGDEKYASKRCSTNISEVHQVVN